MKKDISILSIAICFMMLAGLFAGIQVSAAEAGDLYYLDGDRLYFDINSMKNVSSGREGADIRFGSSGSSNYFVGVNGASMKDMGVTDFDGVKVPDSGYSTDRLPVQQDHVYAVRCGDGAYGVIKVTGCNSDEGTAEFMARLDEPENRQNLYYLDGDRLRFNFEKMADVSSSKDSDIYFKFIRTSIAGENGSSIKDLGVINYENAKAPLTGYSTADIKLVKDHVYAIRCGNRGFYIIKATNVVSESNIEFIAKPAEKESANNTQNDKNSKPDQPSSDKNIEPPKGTDEEGKRAGQVGKKELYWVENQSRFVLGGKILFEDSDGIIEPFLSPNKKSIIYSNGSYELLMYDTTKKSKKVIYKLKKSDQTSYGVYPVGWSQDNKQVAFMTSHKGGFIGGNQLCILNLSDKKVSIVVKGLSSADWGKNGRFVVANGKDVWMIDKLGRNKVKLKVPTARAFFGADNVSFTADCTKVVYIVAEKYYLHDIKNDEYEELAIPEEAASNGTVRSGKDGKIAFIQDGGIYIYNPEDLKCGLLYEDAESSYPNWVSR